MKLKRKVITGVTWYGKLLGVWGVAPFPFRWDAGNGVSDMVSIVQEQEQILQFPDAGYINENDAPAEMNIIKNWTATTCGVIK